MNTGSSPACTGLTRNGENASRSNTARRARHRAARQRWRRGRCRAGRTSPLTSTNTSGGAAQRLAHAAQHLVLEAFHVDLDRIREELAPLELDVQPNYRHLDDRALVGEVTCVVEEPGVSEIDNTPTSSPTAAQDANTFMRRLRRRFSCEQRERRRMRLVGQHSWRAPAPRPPASTRPRWRRRPRTRRLARSSALEQRHVVEVVQAVRIDQRGDPAPPVRGHQHRLGQLELERKSPQQLAPLPVEMPPTAAKRSM